MENLVATAEIDIDAPRAEVWAALTDPEAIARYFFGARVAADWEPGGRIVWRGEYEGRQYEDKGVVLEVERNRRLKFTHFSPLSGLPDEPENYHTITYEIEGRGDITHVLLSQDNNHGEAEAEHAANNWTMMLQGLKKTVEERG
jgi:uncharacterized protein YndB with AHSA1/START domain